MKVTVTISNKAYWVKTWQLMSGFAKQSKTATLKQAKTNPDGTVSAEIDRDQLPGLIETIRVYNETHRGANSLTLHIEDHSSAQDNRIYA
jgi:hypothetical protein